MARAIQRSCEDAGGPALTLDAWLEGWRVPAAVLEAQAAQRLITAQELWPERPEIPDARSIGELPIDRADVLDRLDDWLTCRENEPDPTRLIEELRRLFDRDFPGVPKEAPEERPASAAGPPRPSLGHGGGQVAFAPDDPLRQAAEQIARLLVAVALFGAPPVIQRHVLRAALLLGLIELIVTGLGPRGPQDVLWALRFRKVLVPQRCLPRRSVASVLARAPGWADLYVVRQEWNRYVPGEIGHIENVLTGEFKERVHTRTDETEVTVTASTETSRSEQRDIESTTRFELNVNTDTDTSLAVHVEGQVDTSGQYGPTKVDTHLGGSLDYSRQESEERATRLASELIARAVVRVEERVREERVTRTLTRIVEQNTHRLDNDTGSPVVGMYRWVDKIVRLQKFRYPDRFLLEFELPEPAAYVRWLGQHQGDRGFRNALPTPFTLDGSAEDDAHPRLLPTDVSEDPASPGYYLRLAARYQAQGVTPPPPPRLTATGRLSVTAPDPSQDNRSRDCWVTPLTGSGGGSGGAGGGVDGQSVTVPAGYVAEDNWRGWLSTADQTELPVAAWKSGNAAPSWLLEAPELYVTIGASANNPADVNPLARNQVVGGRSANPLGAPAAPPLPYGAVSLPVGGQLTGRDTGVLPITVLARNFPFASLEVEVNCTRVDTGALLTWQLQTYDLVRGAYFEMLRAHEEERAAREVRAGVQIAGRSPLENARIARDELKRQVIEMLLGEAFRGYDALTLDAADGRPGTDLAAVARSAPLIQFFEQVFEWENLTYVFYPYFWAAASRWDDLQPIATEDPEYARFLRAGSARVVVSARPGFSCAVAHYLCTGQPWGTDGTAPLPGDKDYISIADEIGAQTGAPDDGTPSGSSWEVRLPTTLLYLDADAALPKMNGEAELPAPEED
jgi:hypothetical protein